MFKRLQLVLLALVPAVLPAATANSLVRTVREVDALRTTGPGGRRFAVDGIVIFREHHPHGLMLLFDGTNAFTEIRNGSPTSTETLRFGDRIRVAGALSPRKARGTDQYDACCGRVELLARDQLTPRPVSANELLHHKPDHSPVILEGQIVDAYSDDVDDRWALFIVESDGCMVYVSVERPYDFSNLVGARVRVTGIHSHGSSLRPTMNNVILLDSMEMIEVLEPPSGEQAAIGNVEDFPFLTRDNMRASSRFRATGTVIATWGGCNLLVRTDSGRMVKGELRQPPLPAYGERIDVVGFPETDLYIPILIRAEWSPADGTPHTDMEVIDATTRELHNDDNGIRKCNFRYNGRLVRLTGIVRGLPIENGDGLIYLENEGQIVLVDVSSNPELIAKLSVGCIVEVTGLCVMGTEKMTLNRLLPRINGYRIVVRTPQEVRVLARPSWWTVPRLLIALAVLLATVLGVLFWNVLLRRAVARRSRELEAEITARVGSEFKVFERTRLAVELHDSISQNLTGVAMELRTADIVASKDPQTMHRHLSLAAKTLDSCRDELRNCIWDLRNLTLEELSVNDHTKGPRPLQRRHRHAVRHLPDRRPRAHHDNPQQARRLQPHRSRRHRAQEASLKDLKPFVAIRIRPSGG